MPKAAHAPRTLAPDLALIVLLTIVTLPAPPVSADTAYTSPSNTVRFQVPDAWKMGASPDAADDVIVIQSTSASSLLAAQCSGVSDPLRRSRTFGSAPAAMSTRTTSGPFGKKPGQSVTIWSGVRLPALPPRLEDARPGFSSRSF